MDTPSADTLAWRARRDPATWKHDAAARVNTRWTFTWPLPVPVDGTDLSCVRPGCDGEYMLKSWHVFVRHTGSTTPWRCDIAEKCSHCGQVIWSGVLMPRDAYLTAVAAGHDKHKIDHVDGWAILTAAGYLAGGDRA